MSLIDDRVFAAPTADKDAFIGRIRADAPRTDGPQWRTKTRAAVTIRVLANQRGMRI